MLLVFREYCTLYVCYSRCLLSVPVMLERIRPDNAVHVPTLVHGCYNVYKRKEMYKTYDSHIVI